MAKKNVQIDEKLHAEVTEFCKINGIKVTDFCNDAVKNWLQLSKFGDAPFFEPPTVNVKLPGELKRAEVSFKLNDDGSTTQIATEAMQEALDNKLYEKPVEVTHPSKEQWEPIRRGGSHWVVELKLPKAEWPDDKPKDEEKEPQKPRKRRL